MPGMRQVVIQGAARPPTLEDLTGCLVSMSWPPSGSFRCSDDVVNWLNDATRRTVVAYTTFLPNDPVREWKAWMQDPQNMFWSSAYLFDSQTMYERWQGDIVEGQRPDGSARTSPRAPTSTPTTVPGGAVASCGSRGNGTSTTATSRCSKRVTRR